MADTPTHKSVLTQLFGDRFLFIAEHWRKNTPSFQQLNSTLIQRLIELPCLQSIQAICDSHGNGIIQAPGLRLEKESQLNTINSSDVATLLAKDHAVIFSDFHHSSDLLNRCLSDLTHELGFPEELGFISLFVTPNQSGLSRHFDTKDIFVIGIRGKKQFKLYPNKTMPYPLQNQPSDSALNPMNEIAFGPDVSFDTESNADCYQLIPGSVLFIPRGYWHETIGEADISWSLSFAVERPTWLDAYLRFTMLNLIRNPKWREPIPSLYDVDTWNNNYPDFLEDCYEHLPKPSIHLNSSMLRKLISLALHKTMLPSQEDDSRINVYSVSSPIEIEIQSDLANIYSKNKTRSSAMNIPVNHIPIYQAIIRCSSAFTCADVAQLSCFDKITTAQAIDKLEQNGMIQKLL